MRLRRHVAGAIGVALLAACGASGAGTSSLAPPPTAASSSPAGCAEQVLGRMTEDQRIGQLFAMGIPSSGAGPAEADAIRALHVGTVWFVDNSPAGVSAMRAAADAVQAMATGAGLFVAANQEGGQIQALRGPGFSRIPAAVVQGTMDGPSLESSATGWGRELRAAGVNLDFAPVLDVVPPGTDAQNQPIGALQREYGHDPAAAGAAGAAFARGLAAAGVAATAKHFPGLGRVAGNTDFSAGVVDRTTVRDDPYLRSFRQGIAAGVPFVMVALAMYTRIDPDRLAVFSPVVMRTMLRGDLGFKGVVVSDDLGGAAAVASIPPGRRATDFLAAGGDLVVSKTVEATAAMSSAVRSTAASDAAFRGLVDAAALRVLRAKQAYGLLSC